MTNRLELSSHEGLKSAKNEFLNILRVICGGNYVVDENNRVALTAVFYWLIRASQPEANLNPMKGLWIYGTIGSGKTALMRAAIAFIKRYWRVGNGEKLSPTFKRVSDLCQSYAANGIGAFTSLPTGFDELGTEAIPVMHNGYKMNVMEEVFSRLSGEYIGVPKIVTTNLSLKQVRELYSPRSFDRIGQLFNLVPLNGITRRDSASVWDALAKE